MRGEKEMKKLINNDVKKGDMIFVKEMSPMWNREKQDYDNVCFEYVFEVTRNNPKTLGCKHINGPYSGSGFNWVKGCNLTNSKKEYFLIEDNSEITERNYNV